MNVLSQQRFSIVPTALIQKRSFTTSRRSHAFELFCLPWESACLGGLLRRVRRGSAGGACISHSLPSPIASHAHAGHAALRAQRPGAPVPTETGPAAPAEAVARSLAAALRFAAQAEDAAPATACTCVCVCVISDVVCCAVFVFVFV